VIVARTPYRLSLFGGGCDYPEWFTQHETQVVAAAIARYCYITVRELPPFFITHKTRLVYSEIESVKGNSDIRHPSVRACLNYLERNDGLEIHHDGDLPARSGIGSSSAFTVGLLHALHQLASEPITPHELARQAIEVEQVVIREPVGVQDQVIAAYGGVQVMKLSGLDKIDVHPLTMTPTYRAYVEESILLGFVGVERLSAEHSSKVVGSIQSGAIDGPLHEVSGLAGVAIKCLQDEGEISTLGKLLQANWKLKMAISPDSATSLAHDLLERAIAAGAFGGKLMGAGGGGFFYVLADAAKHDQIKAELKEVKVWVPVKFDDDGSQVWSLDSMVSHNRDRRAVLE